MDGRPFAGQCFGMGHVQQDLLLLTAAAATIDPAAADADWLECT